MMKCAYHCDIQYVIFNLILQFSIVAKVQLDKTAFVKASLNNKLEFGLAYTQKFSHGAALTLASLVRSHQPTKLVNFDDL